MAKTVGGNKLPNTSTGPFNKLGMKKESSNLVRNSLPVRFSAKPETKNKKHP